VGPALADFQEKYPRVELQVQLTEQLPDLAKEGLDGAIWLWQVNGRHASQWVSRRLAPNRRVLVASPAYVSQRGTPAGVNDLQDHACLIVRENAHEANNAYAQRFDIWPLHRTGHTTPERVRVSGPLSSNSGELVRDWCLEGHGIMLRSLWDIAPQLAAGQLVQLLPDYCMPDADIHWLAPYRPEAPKRIRLLIDFLVARFQSEPWKARAPLNALSQGERPG
jgi:DNA-binding transcriptional LysR family regulator